jgi:predicted unusual protein kinase regulating ubiquinone biosynthesis (AarF/ABC1/UbiB family)
MQRMEPSAEPAAPTDAAPTDAAPAPGERQPIDERRFRKLRRFLVRTFVMAFWQDVVLNRPLLRWARTPPLARWQRVARRYRALAVEMGGVLIKLGQFLSIRVDVLPPEVLRELAGLQDEVPPEPLAEVVAQVEEDFGRTLAELFSHFEPVPLGAASLAQVHAARLPPERPGEAGEAVVVKVLRPGIGRLVETDLKALRLAVRWLWPWKRLRRHVDLKRLAEEVTTTTRAELDMPAEGRNAERFAHDFANDPRVRIPRVYWQRTSARTLTLENVAFVKIGDHAALAAAGVSLPEVAKRLYQAYMKQVFVHNFVHADPHPGNLFVRPLPASDPAGGERPEAAGGRDFELVFVDFGMVAGIPPRLRAALREYLYGLGTRDSERMVQAYQAAGVLLPGADLRRLVEAHEDLFQRFWGVPIGELRDTALAEARYFLREYRDLLFEMPFQIQVDMLFVSRAVGILAGLATSLDPEFDPWAETIPFAEELAAEELSPGLAVLARQLGEQARIALRLPERLDALLLHAERGTLPVQTRLEPEVRRTLERLDRTGRRLVWTVAAAGLLLSGVLLRGGSPDDPLALWLLGGAAATFLWGLLRHGR